MLVTHELHIDLTKHGCQPVVAAVQGEANTRQLAISLFSNRIAWEIPEGATAAVAFLKPDGTKGLYDKLPNGAPATTLSGNTVNAILAPQALTCAGIVLASVVFYDLEGDTLATFPFKITVEKNPAAGEQISNDYYNPSIFEIDAAVKELEKQVEALKAGGTGGGSGGTGAASGATFTPAVSDDGTLSWTNDKGLDNPEPVNIKGPKGEKGDTGPEGPQGQKGDTGATGSQGPKGDTGAAGPAGPQGLIWRGAWDSATSYAAGDAVHYRGCAYICIDGHVPTGLEPGTDDSTWGLLAVKGDNGDKGDTGATGSQGPKGDTGATGPEGPKGDKGDTGPEGPQGQKGDKGDTGPKGDPGDDGEDGVGIASIQQTTTSTADGGSNVFTVTLGNGTKATFTVKNGSKGSKGDTGPQGPAGNDGATGPEGPQGQKGDKGDKGDTGPEGPQGPKGDKGDTGATGPKGDTGSQGPKGDTGATGPAYTLNDADRNTIAAAVKSSLSTLTVTGIDADGVSHSWTMYGVAQ